MPLYDELFAGIEKVEPRTAQEINSRLSSSTPQTLEVCYAIIIHHFLLSLDNPPEVLDRNPVPYSGKTFEGGKGVLFNAKEFDPILLRILTKFVNSVTK